MKLNTQKIIWFEKPNKKERLTATLCKNKKLLVNAALFNVLPENIKFGFDVSSRTMVIAESDNSKNKKFKNGTVYGLVDKITEIGMKLPVCFEFGFEEENDLWVGKVILRKKNKEYDMEQLLVLFKPTMDRLFTRMGKTTPKEDRRQIINLALCEAAKEYTPAYGNFEEFIENYVKKYLLLNNHRYVLKSREDSMDRTLTDDAKFNLYSVKGLIDSGYVQAENRIAEEQFEKSLTRDEREVYLSLGNGMGIAKIADKLKISEDKITLIANMIAVKRRKFFL